MSAGVWLKRGGAPGWEAARTQGREGGGLSLTVDRKASVAHRHECSSGNVKTTSAA